METGEQDLPPRVQRYLANEAAARDHLATLPEGIQQRLNAWQESRSEWFSDTLLEIIAEFIQESPDPAITTLQATVERQAAEIKRLTREREQIAHNKRVNDAIQTAFERGELSFTSAGYLTGDTNAG